MVEWSCTKERLNERGPYIFVEWSCAYKRNKSVGTLNSGRMVVHIDSAKMPQQLPDYYSYAFSLIYLLGEFSLKEIRTWGLYGIGSSKMVYKNVVKV